MKNLRFVLCLAVAGMLFCGEKKSAIYENVAGPGTVLCAEYEQKIAYDISCSGSVKCLRSSCPETSPLDKSNQFTKCESTDYGQKVIQYAYLGGTPDLHPEDGELLGVDVYRNICKRRKGKFSVRSGGGSWIEFK